MSSAIIIGAAISTGGALYASNQQKKAAKAQQEAAGNMSTGKPYEPIDIFEVGMEAAQFNAGPGKAMAIRTASDFNRQAVTDVEDAMARLFGGGEAYANQRKATNSVVQDHLAGRLTASARADLGRKLLGSGVTDLGPGAADDAYTGYVGLTQEALATQGVQEYQSLRQGYRDSVKLINPADIFEFFGIQPSTAIGAEINQAAAATGQFNVMAGLANGQQCALGQAAQTQANNNAETVAALTKIAASSYTAYKSNQPKTTTTTTQTGTAAPVTSTSTISTTSKQT